MFESIRKHRNWLMPLLSVVVFLPFVFSGVYGFTRFLGDDNTVAKLDGEPISQADFDAAHRERIERMMQMFGNNSNIDPKMFDSPQIRSATLETLINTRAVEHEASRLHLTLTDEHLREIIGSIPQFQKDGKFDLDTYRMMLNARGFSVESFQARVASDAGRQTIESGVVSGSFVPQTVLERIYAIEGERRQVRRFVVHPEEFAAKAVVDDAAVQADYAATKDQYRVPERAKVQYLVLRLADLAARVPVSEQALHDAYDQNKARWTGSEQRRASHILIAAGKDAPAAERAAAKAQAQDILAQVRARPADFARLAREKSKDPGSAAKGGDLGWFGRTMMVKPFEDAAFALKEGQVSDVVESDFGYHIILLTGIKPAEVRPFAEVRGTLDAELRKQGAQKAYAEQADAFTNLVFEQADSLDAAAAKFQLPLQVAEGVTRQGVVGDPTKAAVFRPAVLEALFAPDATEKHHNTKAIDVGNSTLVSARVLEYVPASVRPFEEVRAAIKGRLEHAAAAKLAQAAGAERLAAFKAAPDDKGFEPVRDVSRNDRQYLPGETLQEIMSLPEDKLPAFVGAGLGDGSYVILHVLGVTHVAPAAPQEIAEKEKSWTEKVASAEEGEYIRALRERFGARVPRADLSPAAAKPGDKPPAPPQ